MANAIILAGGNGARLRGIAATGMKPLLVHEGEALISRLGRQAQKHCGRVVIVVSPLNAAAICDLMGEEYEYVVQPVPAGPGDALARGLTCVGPAEETLVLMGDNIISDGDMRVVADTDGYDVVIGTKQVHDFDEAKRYTRIFKDVNTGHWVTEEGPISAASLGPPWSVWCGPLKLNTDRARLTIADAYEEHLKNGAGEFKIGPWLANVGSVCRWHVDARDIGIPEEVRPL